MSESCSTIPPRKSHARVKSGEDMMDVLAHDIMRYEMLSEQDEYKALASVLQGNESEDFEFELQEVQLQPLPELQAVDDQFESEDPGAQSDEKERNKRYVDISLQDTDKFLQDNANKNTIYKTKSDMKLFYDWAQENDEMRKVEEIPHPELDLLLARFYLGVRKRDGIEYEPDTLTGIQNSTDRHLKNLKSKVDIKKDEQFTHSRKVLEAKRKQLKSQGKSNKKNRAESLDADETKALYEKQLLGAANPKSLLNTVWLNNGVFFGFRGRQEHSSLMLGDLELKTCSSGKEYLELNERTTKTRTGANSSDQRAVPPKMFAQPENPYCPIAMYKLYIQKRPEDLRDMNSRFYLRPLDNPKDDVWYSHQPLGKNKLGIMMKSMATIAEITGRKVNHSTRKTFASTLLHADRQITEVTQLGGWKSVATLTNYNVPSLKQQNKASTILSEIMLPETSNIDDVVNDQKEHKNNTPAIENVAVDIQNPTNSQSVINNLNSNTNSNLIASRKDTNPFSILCGATISGGVINLNIFSGKRKLDMLDSSQE